MRFLIVPLILAGTFLGCSQPERITEPDLVLFISMDQVRYDYVEKFRDYFGGDGFKLFLRDGAVFENAHYEHSITSTAPGHAVMSTGTYANRNGIIGNRWRDRETGEEVYCVEDRRSPVVGNESEDGRSPRNLKAATLGDVLRKRTGGQSRVFAFSGKDRSSILMAGHEANGAFWLDDSIFVSSTYYMDRLPHWLQEFNSSHPVRSYFGRVWDYALSDRSPYAAQGPDSVLAELDEHGLGRVFPHIVDGDNAEMVTERYWDAFWCSPFACEVLLDVVKRCVVAEEVGQRDFTDMLCIGFSAPDAVGHNYGPDSHEVLDVLVRLDRLLSDFFDFIDNRIGLDNCLIVLTADHGVARLPELVHNNESGTTAGRVRLGDLQTKVESVLRAEYGEPPKGRDWVRAVTYSQFYFNERLMEKNGIDIEAAERVVAQALDGERGVGGIHTRSSLLRDKSDDELFRKAQHSFHPDRSGNVFLQVRENWIDKTPAGTTHGSPWSYDTHVPLMWYGYGIKAGRYKERVSIVDIAPTIAEAIGVQMPADVQGRALTNLLQPALEKGQTATR